MSAMDWNEEVVGLLTSVLLVADDVDLFSACLTGVGYRERNETRSFYPCRLKHLPG